LAAATFAVAPLLLAGCGSPDAAEGDASQTLIVGGEKVVSTDAIVASTVALVLPNGEPFCTGSLISSRLVLTASHCLDGYDEDMLYVAFGTTAKPGAYARERLRYATKLRMHESYDTVAMDAEVATRPPNDIAVLRLNADAPAGFKPATMLAPTAALYPRAEKLTLAGFGLTHYLWGSTGVLRKVEVNLTSTSTAAKEIEFGATPGKSACMGDSGGPAFVKRSGKLMLVGVTSRGSSHCDDTGIYTDVRQFRDWIARQDAAL
jgi:secreted trypsin-like serine protease